MTSGRHEFKSIDKKISTSLPSLNRALAGQSEMNSDYAWSYFEI